MIGAPNTGFLFSCSILLAREIKLFIDKCKESENCHCELEDERVKKTSGGL